MINNIWLISLICLIIGLLPGLPASSLLSLPLFSANFYSPAQKSLANFCPPAPTALLEPVRLNLTYFTYSLLLRLHLKIGSLF